MGFLNFIFCKFNTQKKKNMKLSLDGHTQERGTFPCEAVYHRGWEWRLWSQTPWVHIPVLPLVSCVALSTHLSVFQCPSFDSLAIWMAMCQMVYAFSTKHFIDYECIINVKCISNALLASICICKLALTTLPCYKRRCPGKPGEAHRVEEREESHIWEKDRNQGCLEGQATRATPRLLLGLVWLSGLLCYREFIWPPNISSCSVCSQASETWESRIFGWVSGMALPALLPELYQEWVKYVFGPLGFHNER